MASTVSRCVGMLSEEKASISKRSNRPLGSRCSDSRASPIAMETGPLAQPRT